MSGSKQLTLAFAVLSSAFLIYFAISFASILFETSSLPDLEVNKNWGKNDDLKTDVSVKKFKINIKKKDIEDLLTRLKMARNLTPALLNTTHEYGFNPMTLKEAVEFLKNDYNFTARQKYLNSFPQFVTEIQGLKIHFLHVKVDDATRKVKRVLPLLQMHGWPSSVREFYEMADVLTKDTQKDFVFDLVIPSLPGFGYSEGAAKTNFRTKHIATIMTTLMERLGYEKFYVHGSDWGAVVATNIATLYPLKTLGFHSNFCFSLRPLSLAKIILGSVIPAVFDLPEEHQSKLYPLKDLLRFYFAESGYLHIFGTKPDTIGTTLADSPISLLSYFLEKLSVGTDKSNVHKMAAGLDVFDKNTVMDILMFYYWFPSVTTTSARIYTENLCVNGLLEGLFNIPINDSVPCGCAFFENEFIYQPPSILKDKFTNLIHYTTYGFGGHFAAIEKPYVLMKDIVSFVEKTL